MPGRLHGTGALPIGPQTFDDETPAKPKKAPLTRGQFTYSKQVNKLKPVTAAQAKALEAKYQGGTKAENLRPGNAGSSVLGIVQKGELFVRVRGTGPNATTKWSSAGKLLELPKAKPKTPVAPKPPKPAKLEDRVQKFVGQRLELFNDPTFQLNATEVAELKQGITAGKYTVVTATPKGLAGSAFTGYVEGDMLVVERKRAGRPSTFHVLGPIP